MVEWEVEGLQFSGCNCDYCCPCQFELEPSHGGCRGFEVVRIDHGHFGGTVSLNGTKMAITYAWPGPIYEGKGELQIIIDEGTGADQRAALERIATGGDTHEGKTHWWVFRAMADTVHPTLYAPIAFDVDLEARRAKVTIPGVLESSARPIISPATGDEHRVRIDIPNGIEFEQAEIGSARARATAAIRLDLVDTYGQFSKLRHSGRGVVHA